MKTFIFSLVLLGCTNLICAQQEIAAVTNNADTYTKSRTAVKNIEYLATFADEDLSQLIKNFQKEVARYDIKTKPFYTADEISTYTVVFNSGANKIITVFNHEGSILSTESDFENVRLPVDVSKKLAKKYPKWQFNKIHCSINYFENNEPSIVYKVLLKKGDKKKTVTINASDFNM